MKSGRGSLIRNLRVIVSSLFLLDFGLFFHVDFVQHTSWATSARDCSYIFQKCTSCSYYKN